MLDDDLAAHIGDYFRCGAAKEDMMTISGKLSWEIVAQNDRGDASAKQRMALEIAYGVSCAQDEPVSFERTMTAIAEQVTDAEMSRLLRLWIKRGLKQ